MKYLFLALVLAGSVCGLSAQDRCVECHGSQETMASQGAAPFTVTAAEVEAQSHMGADCSQCHLGDGGQVDKQAAHKGLLKMIVVSKKGLKADPATRKLPLQMGGKALKGLFAGVEKGGAVVPDPSVASLSWSDMRRDSLTQDFAAMGKTCGQCHTEEFEQFQHSAMGMNAKQKQYAGWHSARGPHDCGPWFDGNFESMQAETAAPMNMDSTAVDQRACNLCHAGCLDCHFDPKPAAGGGLHHFVKTPTSLGCYGGGRGSTCHAGPEDRRRGAGYFGGDYGFPAGGAPDAHLAAKVECLDCHDSSRNDPKLGHGVVKRQAEGSCQRCHAAEVGSHARSRHKNLACEACHIQEVGGYQATYWGPGKMAGSVTPYYKYKAYYGVMAEPIIIRDQRGRWIPVKPFPMAVMNQKAGAYKPGLHWRFPATLPERERTDDAWAYVGLSSALPENNQAMLWIQMDKMSHKLGKARTCQSCHGEPKGAQRQKVAWNYSDSGAKPFSGSHEVLASREGLSIRGLQSGPITLEPGFTLSALAPWTYMKDAWHVKGNFALPVLDGSTRTRQDLASLQAARAHHTVHGQ